MFPHKRRTAMLVLLCIIIALFPVYRSHENEVQAAVWGRNCPQGGAAVEIGDVGCSACGGSGRRWDSSAGAGIGDNMNLGSGLWGTTTEEEQGVGTWTIYYRCYNCGVCPKNSIPAKRVLTTSSSPAYSVGHEETLQGAAPGYVPQRWCSACGPDLKSAGDTWLGREASYTVYHISIDPIVPEDVKFTVTVTYDKGGIAYSDKTEYSKGEKVTLCADSDETHIFTNWTVKAGGPLSGIGTSSANTSFVMPEKNVTVHAGFDKKPNPPATNPPTEELTTPEPTSKPVTNPPSPTPQPTPTVTPEPTINYPLEDRYDSAKYNHYFTSTEGISTWSIINRKVPASKQGEGCGYICNTNSSKAMMMSSALSVSQEYKIGIDANGNEWYFLQGQTLGSYRTQSGQTVGVVEAEYVHPKKYNGYEVHSENIRYITELTFPSTFTLKGVDTATAGTYAKYNVVSIGGGLDKIYTGGTIVGTARQSSNHYGVPGESMFKALQDSTKYKFGVIGNGEITSEGLDLLIYPNYTEDRREYMNNHYVYNTTLQKVTIPGTVRTICDYAFYNCQALTEIIGGTAVTTIGVNAFSSAEHTDPNQFRYTSDRDFATNYYNGALYYSTGTATVNAWKKSVTLSSFMALPEFGSLLTIKKEAFTRRTNLLNVELPSCLETIEEAAFAKCKLGTIKIPGENTVVYDVENNKSYYDTLGTLSSGDEDDDKTLIITNPGAKVIDYGVKYRNYYSLRAGYPLTYVKNTTPNDIYTSISETEIVMVQVAQYASDPLNNNAVNKTYFIDTEGRLWRTMDVYAEECVPGEKFDKVFVSKKTVAMTQKGEAYLYDAGWTKLTAPVGSSSFYFVRSFVSESGSYSSTQGSNSWNDFSFAYFLYFLDNNKNVCRINLASKTMESVSQPLGPDVEYFYVAPYSGGGSVSISGGSSPSGGGENKRYSLSLPTMYIRNSAGEMYIGSKGKTEEYDYVSGTDQYGNYRTETNKSDGWVESEYSNKQLDLSLATWKKSDESITQIEQILLMPGYNPAQGYWQFESLTTYTLKDGNVYSGSSAAIENKNITRIVGSGDAAIGAAPSMFLTATNDSGGCFVYVSVRNASNGTTNAELRQIFGDAEIVNLKSDSTQTYRSEEWIWEGVKYTQTYTTVTHILYIHDSKDRFWKIAKSHTSSGKSGSDGSNEGFSDWGPLSVEQITDEAVRKDMMFPKEPIGVENVEYLWKCMFSRPGYTFKHWTPNADGTGISYLPSERYIITGPSTIYAQWVPAKNILRYRPNGGVGMIPEETYELTVTKALIKENAYTRKGYEFTGWNTQADGKGVSYQAGQHVPLVQEGITYLYAQWKKISSYTIQVSKNDISVRPVVLDDSKTKVLTADAIYTIPNGSDISFKVSYDLQGKGVKTGTSTPKVTLTSANTDGYLTFAGWLLFEKIGTEYDFTGKRYNAGAQVSNLGTKDKSVMTLFPYYTGDAATVLLPLPTCVGYNFIGWGKTKTETDPGKLYHIEEDVEPVYQPSGNETLYAYWEAKTYGVSLIATHPQAQAGEITTTLSSVIMTYDEELPPVRIPQSERFVFMGYYDKLDEDGVPTVDAVQYYDETGVAVNDESTGKKRIWTIDDGSVNTLYAYFVCEIEVSLDGRGATKQEQTTVTMTYEEFGPHVIPPEKTGYTFGGYYTETRGGGKKYYDAMGESVTVWTEFRTDTLYAYWIQNTVRLPEKDEPELPGTLPEERVEIEVALDTSVVHVYADDNDAETGPETDVPPYQVADVVNNGVLETAGGIPSTETVAVRANVGNWLLSCVLERKSGVETVCTKVTVPFRTQYEDAESESLIISEVQYRTVEVLVPKAWSYWELTEGGVYIPDEVVVRNSALVNGQVAVPVGWDGENATKKPEYRLEVYGEKEQHIRWPSCDEAGNPVITLRLTETEYIVSDVPGEEPDVTEYLETVCYNAAWRDATQFFVKSDCVEVSGITVLSDVIGSEGEGAIPNRTVLPELKNRIEKTVYEQTYRDGISLVVTSKNGRYDTFADVLYTAVEENAGDKQEKTVAVTEINEINIHTPVVCIPGIRAEHEDMYQCENVPAGHTVLVLDEEGVHSDFILQIGNTGYHSDKKGYGESDYTKYLAKKDGKEQNEVCFPMPVWIDRGNDGRRGNDILLEAGVWYVLGCENQRFYLPVNTWEGSYEIRFRSVAINGKGDENKTEFCRNVQPAHYVAEGAVSVYVTGRLFEFAVTEVRGNAAWGDVTTPVRYSVGARNPNDTLWDTLPLRTGVHPMYRNVGGLPVGGTMSFDVRSIGMSYGDGAVLKLVPHLVAYDENGYKEVDVYYEEETAKGVFLRKWEDETFTLIMKEYEEQSEAVQQWNGVFSLLERLYVAEKGVDVKKYQAQYGLTFTEFFWRNDVPLVLRFALELTNSQGECLYYGMIPERIANNLWQTEAGASFREDIDGNRYEIQGGEVAVIYPGDSADNEDSTYGIY